MGPKILDDELWLCKLLHDNLQLPVRLLNANREVEGIFNSGRDEIAHPLDPNHDKVSAGIFSEDTPCDIPCYSVWNGFDQYIWLRLSKSSERQGAIVIGPVTSSAVTDEMLAGFLYDYNIPRTHLSSLQEYYQNIPVRYKKSLLHAGTLLYYLRFRKALDPTEVVDCSVPYHMPYEMGGLLERNLTERRLNLNFHHHLSASKLLLQCVKEGRKEGLAQYRDLISQENAGVLSRRSRLRNEKNLAICLTTHAMQAAIDGGLYPEVALTASDLWIQHIEEVNEVEEIAQVMQELLIDFAERVKHQKLNKNSKPITVCQNYIFNRIYEPIKLQELAEVADIHPVYLSKLFKQETGMNVSEYILMQKIEEAKKLLAFSNASPLRTASLLNFYDQSHFTKVFKKYTGVTPKQYKDRTV